MDFSDIVYTGLFFTAALFFPKFLLKGREKQFYPVLQYLVIFHFLIGFVYYKMTDNWGGDAYGYWYWAKYIYTPEMFVEHLYDRDGTLFMRALNYIPANIMDMSFFSNTMLFTMLGSMGITYFFIVTLRLIPHNKKIWGISIFPWIFFLPNLHFWCAGVGKDTLLFWCIGMFTYGMLKPMKNLPTLILAGVLAIAVRPHMVLFMAAGLGAGYIMGGKISFAKRIFFGVLLLGGAIIILPKVMDFARVEDASVESFTDFSEKKSSLLSRGHSGSALDISSYPLPLKVATFWFRPLFFDARSATGLMASVENIILLVIFILAMRASPLKAWRNAPFLVKGLVVYIILGSFAFSQSLGNLGIMIRMRNMFLPAMIIFLLWVFSYEREGQLARVRRIKAIRKRRALQQLKESGEAVQ